MHEAARAEVCQLQWGIDAGSGLEADGCAIRAACDHLKIGAESLQIREPCDGEDLLSGEPQGGGILPGQVLEGQHTKADQVGAVDALKGGDQDGANAEQVCALGSSIAGGAGAVIAAGQDD